MSEEVSKETLQEELDKHLGLESQATITVLKKDVGDYTGVLTTRAAEPEDSFADLYLGASGGGLIIRPPYDLHRLSQLAQENNTLPQCIAAMEVNIDGTGYTIERPGKTSQELAKDKEVQRVKEFWDQPYPGISIITLRRALRRDLETVGNAYMEVIRNAKDDVMFLRRVDPLYMRLVRLDDPVRVPKVIRRNGKDTVVNVMVRERRFAQDINGSIVYFKELGASRDLNPNTGEWYDLNVRAKASDRATEIIHFTCVEDAKTPYGVPRWVSQTPSVLGSRKAEEYNVEFFDSGGIPPVLVFLMGGGLTTSVRKQLEGIFTGKNASRGAVVEVQPMSSGLDSSANTAVKVERFGDRQSDSMFENYDARCEDRIRAAFRLPPIFVGKSKESSFASTFASYTVAEAQVFHPERVEFDNIINLKLSPLISKDCIFRSLPLNVRDIESQLKALGMLQLANVVAGDDLVSAVNEISNLNVRYTPAPAIPPEAINTQVGMTDNNNDKQVDNPAKVPAQAGSPLGEVAADKTTKPKVGNKLKK